MAGLAATFFVTIIGNLGNVKLLFDQLASARTVQCAEQPAGRGQAAPLRWSGAVRGRDAARQPLSFPNDWWFWNASRVIPDTINEFPFFTFTYADLHAHMIALPLTLLALAAAVGAGRLAIAHRVPAATVATKREAACNPSEPSPWRISLPELLPIVLLGFVVGALRATNTWDFPTYVAGRAGRLVVLEASRDGPRLAVPLTALRCAPGVSLPHASCPCVWRLVILLAVGSAGLLPVHEALRHGLRGLAALAGARRDDAARLPDRLGLLPRPGRHLSGERVVRQPPASGRLPQLARNSWPVVVAVVL